MHLKDIFLQMVFAFALVWSCSPHSEEWLKYADFSKLNEACRLKSCSKEKTNFWLSNSGCDCDETCSRYSTCCIDSPYTRLSSINSFGKREECCKVQGTSSGAFMISTCDRRRRRNQMIRTRCESIRPNDKDPLSSIPVTNPLSKLTYKNYFCSLCNFDHRGAVFWGVVLKFADLMPRDVTPAERENILRRLEYNAEKNQWGILSNVSNDNDMEFIPVTIAAQMPFAVGSIVKTCDASLESRCAPTCNDATLKRICQSYISPITMSLGGVHVKFRNPHCALCNYVTNFEEAFCVPIASFAPTLSFTLLLDVNPSDGNKVGETTSCSENEVYDPFFKKCRALVCAIPGQVLKNGKCVAS